MYILNHPFLHPGTSKCTRFSGELPIQLTDCRQTAIIILTPTRCLVFLLQSPTLIQELRGVDVLSCPAERRVYAETCNEQANTLYRLQQSTYWGYITNMWLTEVSVLAVIKLFANAWL
jgi:hypothetical protein